MRRVIINPRNPKSSLEFTALFLIFSAAFYNFSYMTADPDLWGHILFGQAHWESGSLAETDIYSFTACGHEWVNHEWLTELIFYFLFTTFQDLGLLSGKLIIGLAVVFVLFMTCRVRNAFPIVTACVMVAAIWALKPGFMIRPQLFSFLFFSIYLWIFHLFFRQKMNCLYCLPLVMALWVNLHGGFLMGGALIALIVLWETCAHAVCRDRSRNLKLLWGWALVTAAAVLLNPYGYHLLVFLYKSLSQPREITEWMPVAFQDTSYIHFKLLGVASLAVLVLRGRRNQGWEMAVLLFTGIFALRHQRNIIFFVIAAAPYLTVGFTELVEALPTKNRRLSMSTGFRVVIGFLFAAIAAGYLFLGGRIYAAGNGRIIVDPNVYPVSAVEFMRNNRLQGNLIVHFDWGEYAIWKLYPGCKVSIDGRFRTVYPETVIRDHLIFEGSAEKLYTALEKYPADLLLFPRTPFTALLMQKKEKWVYVYSDALAFVFLRRNENNKALLNRFQTSGFDYPEPETASVFP